MSLPLEKFSSAMGMINDQVIEGEWTTVTSHMGCCDCGLIHRMTYRVVDELGEEIILPTGWKFQFVAVRDDDLTRGARENFSLRVKDIESFRKEGGK